MRGKAPAGTALLLLSIVLAVTACGAKPKERHPAENDLIAFESIVGGRFDTEWTPGTDLRQLGLSICEAYDVGFNGATLVLLSQTPSASEEYRRHVAGEVAGLAVGMFCPENEDIAYGRK